MEAVLQNVQNILEPIDSDFEPILVKSPFSENVNEIKSQLKKQGKILKNVIKKIDKIEPPDDFFAGHSNVIEFTQLLLDTNILIEEALEDDSKTNQSDLLKVFQESNQSLNKAMRQLDFLDLELRQAFEDTNSNMRTLIQQVSQKKGEVKSTNSTESK